MFLALFVGVSVAEQFAADFVFRMHNSKGWTGTKTKFDGHSGYVVELSPDTNIDTFFAAKRERPEVIVMPLSLLTDANVKKIQNLYRPKLYLQGIVVMNSEASNCLDVVFPNADQACYNATGIKWNSDKCDAMISQVYDVPIVFPPQSQLLKLKDHLKKYGEKAGIYMRVFMQSRGTDEKCLKDDMCQPVGGLSMFGGFEYDLNKPAVWAITSFDAYGIFPYGTVGADYSISGFVAQYAALEAMKGLDWTKAKKPLRFAFFDAEETGYMGSQRFLNDIQKFECKKWDDSRTYCLEPYRIDRWFENISLDSFDTIVEMRQVANADNIWAHVNGSTTSELLKTIQTIEPSIKAPTRDVIPPSSTNSFLKVKKDLPHVVLTGFDDQYPTNNRYGSPADATYDVTKATAAAQKLANVLIGLCFGEGTDVKVTVNSTVVEGLYQGFVNAARDSEYLISLFPNTNLPTDHVSLYPGVYSFYTFNVKQLVIRNGLKDSIAYNVTDQTCESDNDCSNLNQDGSNHLCSRDGVCEAVSLNSYPAYSLAYEWSYDDQKYYMVDTTPGISRFAEANWLNPDLQFTTLPAPLTGRITTGVGIFLWVATTIVLGWFWRKNLDKMHKD